MSLDLKLAIVVIGKETFESLLLQVAELTLFYSLIPSQAQRRPRRAPSEAPSVAGSVASSASSAAGRRPSEFLRGREFSRAPSVAGSVAGYSEASGSDNGRPAWGGGGGNSPRGRRRQLRQGGNVRRSHGNGGISEGEIRHARGHGPPLPPVAEEAAPRNRRPSWNNQVNLRYGMVPSSRI